MGGGGGNGLGSGGLKKALTLSFSSLFFQRSESLVVISLELR